MGIAPMEGTPVTRVFLLLAGLAGLIIRLAATEAGATHASVIVVIGVPGEPTFLESFQLQATQWEAAAKHGNAAFSALGVETNAVPDHDRLKALLEAEPSDGDEPLWLVLIGHGSFDGREARFNLRGPDLPATELAEWLKRFQRPLAVIDTSSSSAPFMAALSKPGRIIVTATRSGYEQNATRFGRFFAQALSDPKSDIDGDGQTSLLEAFLFASRAVAASFSEENRLASEHALIDDNGDKLGTPADWFRGLRATKSAEGGASPDGARAARLCLVKSPRELALSPEVRAKRDALELEADNLYGQRAALGDDEYFRQLEAIMLDLAHLTLSNRPAAPAR
jgi:hypothetical protein